MSAGWTDSHCHLDPDEDWVAAAAAQGVDRIVNVGIDLGSSATAIAVAAEHDGVWATAGVHPHEASSGLDGIEPLLDRVVAVGECGLDYHYDHSPRAVQREVFADQVELARTHGLPLVIHSREAWSDTFAILEAHGAPSGSIFHCFTGGPDEARRALDLGAWLSFSGIVTFPSATDVQAAAALAPLDRVLVETDSPYLAPVPHRGRPNRPELLPDVGAGLAAAMGRTVSEVAAATAANAATVFGLD